jgi:hypothetical protein
LLNPGRPGRTAQEKIVQGKIVRGVSQSFCVLYLSFGAFEAAHKLGRFVDIQNLSFLLNHVTEKMDI